MSEPYVFQPYPRHVHKPHGAFVVVYSDEERDAKVAEGWFLTPLEAEQSVSAAPPSEDVPDEAPPAPVKAPRPRKAR